MLGRTNAAIRSLTSDLNDNRNQLSQLREDLTGMMAQRDALAEELRQAESNEELAKKQQRDLEDRVECLFFIYVTTIDTVFLYVVM